MASNDQSRRTVPQHLTGAGDPLWTGDVPDAPVHDALDGPNSWMNQFTQRYIFDEHFALSGNDGFFPSSLYGNTGLLSLDPRDGPYGQTPNALGLDPITASAYLDPSHQLHSANPSPRLPQIITSSLSSPQPHSPADFAPSNSAYSSSPSSVGHSTIPMTPATLPSTSQLGLPLINTGTLLSPSSPHPWYGSPAPKSPFPSPAELSPSMMSYSSSSPTDELPPVAFGTVHHVPQMSVQEIAASFPNANLLVPQRTYRPHTQSDRRRYVEEVQLELPILFHMTQPIGLGISCRDALNCKFARLDNRDDAMFINRGPSVSIRIMWPGYAPWSRQIPTRDFRSPPGPITRSKLAKNVAKTVQRFLDEMKNKPMEEEADRIWKIVGGRITVDDLDLVGLQHVSMGSWQAHLRLRPRT